MISPYESEKKIDVEYFAAYAEKYLDLVKWYESDIQEPLEYGREQALDELFLEPETFEKIIQTLQPSGEKTIVDKLPKNPIL